MLSSYIEPVPYTLVLRKTTIYNFYLLSSYAMTKDEAC